MNKREKASTIGALMMLQGSLVRLIDMIKSSKDSESTTLFIDMVDFTEIIRSHLDRLMDEDD